MIGVNDLLMESMSINQQL